MQILYFDRAGPCAGFVIHGITDVRTPMRISAWFAADGRYVDAEAVDAMGRSRSVPAKLLPRLRQLGHQFKERAGE